MFLCAGLAHWGCGWGPGRGHCVAGLHVHAARELTPFLQAGSARPGEALLSELQHTARPVAPCRGVRIWTVRRLSERSLDIIFKIQPKFSKETKPLCCYFRDHED